MISFCFKVHKIITLRLIFFFEDAFDKKINIDSIDGLVPIWRQTFTPINEGQALQITQPGLFTYREVSNIRRTKSQNLSVSRPALQLSLPNLVLKPCIKSRMKM